MVAYLVLLEENEAFKRLGHNWSLSLRSKESQTLSLSVLCPGYEVSSWGPPEISPVYWGCGHRPKTMAGLKMPGTESQKSTFAFLPFLFSFLPSSLPHSLPLFLLFFQFFNTGFLCLTALTVLELALWTRLALDHRDLPACLPRAGIKGMCHQRPAHFILVFLGVCYSDREFTSLTYVLMTLWQERVDCHNLYSLCFE